MNIHVRFRPPRQADRAFDLEADATVADLMLAAGESIDVTVCIRDGRPIAEDAPLVDGETLTLLSAASGG